jgi:hypothetical protein
VGTAHAQLAMRAFIGELLMTYIIPNWMRAIVPFVMLIGAVSERSARADLVRHTLRGTITEVESPLDALFGVGQPVVYRMTIDMATTDVGWFPQQGAYPAALQGVDANVGVHSFTWTGESLIYVDNNIDPGEGPLDRFQHNPIPNLLPSFDVFEPWMSQVRLRDDDASAFASKSLSEVPPSNLAAFEAAVIDFTWSYPNSGRDRGHVVASIDSWEVIPEPCAMALAGAFALAWPLVKR